MTWHDNDLSIINTKKLVKHFTCFTRLPRMVYLCFINCVHTEHTERLYTGKNKVLSEIVPQNLNQILCLNTSVK